MIWASECLQDSPLMLWILKYQSIRKGAISGATEDRQKISIFVGANRSLARIISKLDLELILLFSVNPLFRMFFQPLPPLPIGPAPSNSPRPSNHRATKIVVIGTSTHSHTPSFCYDATSLSAACGLVSNLPFDGAHSPLTRLLIFHWQGFEY